VSYRNAVVVDQGQGPIAGLISYRRPFVPQRISETAPAIAVPWQELTNLALGTWHIGAIALYPDYRGQGWGTRLMRIADELRQASGASRSSLLVADANRARRLYERFGFREEARRPVVTGNWQNPGKDWLLLIRG
jgi:ribosomal protein S18 acetylase RimI-like enzyme